MSAGRGGEDGQVLSTKGERGEGGAEWNCPGRILSYVGPVDGYLE